jgi:hypothetical protein
MTGSDALNPKERPVVSDREFALLQQLQDCQRELQQAKIDNKLIAWMNRCDIGVEYDRGDPEVGVPARFKIWRQDGAWLDNKQTHTLLGHDPDLRTALIAAKEMLKV